MEVLNKVLPWVLIVGLVIVGFVLFGYMNKQADDRLETYKRQVAGQLTEKEKELQSAHHEINIYKSKLVEHIEQLEETNDEFDKFKKEHNLVIQSRDRSIALLKQQINNGITLTTVDPSCDINNLQGCVISYHWKDPYGRFNLIDPNIFQDGATFESEQYFKIYGEIYSQKDSSLQTRRLILKEVVKDGNAYKEIPNANAQIIDSEFTYTNAPDELKEWNWKELFRLRGIAVGGIELLPHTGDITFGAGLEFFTFYGFGIGSFTSLNFQHPELIAQHISLQYNPTIMDTELNLGAFVSIGTPFANFFNGYQFSTGLVFYLNN